MNRRNHQRRVLAHLAYATARRSLMRHPGMSFVRWLLESSNENENKDLGGLTEGQVRRSLYYLEKKRFLRKVKLQNGKIKIELTDKGKERARIYSIEDVSIRPAEKWDGKWRFVMFDIPESNRYMRGIFRDKLINLGFFRAQKSVWVYPYDCEEEISSLAEFLQLQDSVLIFTAALKRDNVLRTHFSEKGIKL